MSAEYIFRVQVRERDGGEKNLPCLDQLSLSRWLDASQRERGEKENGKEGNKERKGKKRRKEIGERGKESGGTLCSTRHNTTQIRNKAYI